MAFWNARGNSAVDNKGIMVHFFTTTFSKQVVHVKITCCVVSNIQFHYSVNPSLHFFFIRVLSDCCFPSTSKNMKTSALTNIK